MAISHYQFCVHRRVRVSRDHTRNSFGVSWFAFAHPSLIDLYLFLRLVITDRCQDTDDTDEYVLGEIDEYELDYTSSSEDLFSNGTSSGTDVMKPKNKKTKFRWYFMEKITNKKIIGHCGESGSACYVPTIEQQLGWLRNIGRRCWYRGIGCTDRSGIGPSWLLDVYKVQKSEKQSTLSVLREMLPGKFPHSITVFKYHFTSISHRWWIHRLEHD